MSPKLMIWISVSLSAVAQIFLKQGLNCLQRNRARRQSIGLLVLDVVCQPHIWLWGTCFLLATLLWLLGLQRLDLSYAYPLVAFGYVLVNILSAMFFQENVTRDRWIAVAVIWAGVALIAGS